MRLVAACILYIALVALLCVGWGGGKAPAVNVIGSTSIQPFAEMLAQEFHRQDHGALVDVQGGGSTAGVEAVANGLADIGMCSRGLKGDECTEFRQFIIALDGLAIVVHRDNPVTDLTLDHVRRLFAGEVVNWRGLGGEDRSVCLITREEGSGTREAFMKLVMHKSRIARAALTQESNGAVKELVRHDRGAVGYMSLGLVGDGLKSLRIGGVPATAQDVRAQRYPLVRPLLFITRGAPSPRSQAFIDFVLSDAAQQTLEKEGLVRVR